jgi:hypothetical protein
MRRGRGSGPARRITLGALAVALACTTGAPAFLPLDEILPLQERTEQARGLSFGEPVRAQLVSRGKVEPLLEDAIGRAYTPELRRRDEAVKKALGLLPPEADLWEALLEFQSAALVGFYAPLDRQLYVVADSAGEGVDALLGPEAAQILVHELAHALQASHSVLVDVTLGLVDHDDLAFALGALLEGDATWAGYRDEALRYGLPMPSPEAVASKFEALWPGGEHDDVPRLVREGLVLLYPSGYELATRLFEAGGIPALDAALADPPLTSRDALHPDRYLDPARRRPLLLLQLERERIAPSPECTTVGANSFGEFGLRIWAEEREAEPSEAIAAAEGWDADRALVLDCPAGEAFAWLVQFESAARAQAFAEVARRVARPETDVDELGTRVLLSANLSDSGRDSALLDTESRSYRDLSEYLAARPEILGRARELHRRSASGRDGGGHHPAEGRGGERQGNL